VYVSANPPRFHLNFEKSKNFVFKIKLKIHKNKKSKKIEKLKKLKKIKI
jgi:hypothetical protein